MATDGEANSVSHFGTKYFLKMINVTFSRDENCFGDILNKEQRLLIHLSI